MSKDVGKDIGKTLGILASIAVIIGTCIAAIALIPAFGSWLSPREPIQYVTPSDNGSPGTSETSPTAKETPTFMLSSNETLTSPTSQILEISDQADPHPTPGYINPDYEGITVNGRYIYQRPMTSDPVWAPDGLQIAFINCENNCLVYTIQSDGSNLRQIGSGYSAQRLNGLSWSPDGKRLAFANDNGTYTNELAIIDVASGNFSVIANKAGEDIQWSPDGRMLAFWVRDEGSGDDGWVIWTANTDRSNLKRLTSVNDGYGDFNPRWTLDSQHIIFNRWKILPNHERGVYQVWWIKPDGSQIEQLPTEVTIINQRYFPWSVILLPGDSFLP